jgi:ABC-type nitrate/sulfonate/bicarbonate transport system substrate-binding protein
MLAIVLRRAGVLGLLIVLGVACGGGAAPAAKPAATGSTAPAAAGGAPAASPAAAGAPLTAPAASAAPVKPAALEPLSAMQISVSGNYLPFYIVDKKGFYAQHGLELERVVTDSPTKAVQAISAASVDLAFVSPDAAILAIEQGAPLAIVAGGQNSIPYSLIAQPSIRTFGDLRGKDIGVSNLTSGPTLILRKMMAGNGLNDGDYDLVPAGGTAERFAAIKSGVVAAGLLLQPEDLTLMAEGFNRVGLATDYVPRFQWVAVVVHKSWLRDHEDKLVRALRALNEAYRWVYDPRNRDEAIAILMEATRTTPELARQTYELYVDRLKIWPLASELDDAAMRGVIELMGEMNQLRAPLPEPAKYADLSYLRKATAAP